MYLLYSLIYLINCASSLLVPINIRFATLEHIMRCVCPSRNQDTLVYMLCTCHVHTAYTTAYQSYNPPNGYNMFAFVIKLAGGLLFFLPFPYICGGHYISLHYFTLLYITWGIFPYFTLHVCALWWRVVISLSLLLCGIQPQWLCGPYHDLLCVWELLSCHSLSVSTVVTPFSILCESSITIAVRTLCFSFVLTEQLYVRLTLHYPILYFWAAALLYSMCALLYTTLFSTSGLRPSFPLYAPSSPRPYSSLR